MVFNFSSKCIFLVLYLLLVFNCIILECFEIRFEFVNLCCEFFPISCFFFSHKFVTYLVPNVSDHFVNIDLVIQFDVSTFFLNIKLESSGLTLDAEIIYSLSVSVLSLFVSSKFEVFVLFCLQSTDSSIGYGLNKVLIIRTLCFINLTILSSNF
jgi:hypothetical protein